MFDAAEAELKDGRVVTIRLAVPDDARAITDFVNTVGREKQFVLRERATWTLDEERVTLAAADGKDSAFFVGEIEGRISALLNIARGRWPKNYHVAEFGMACLPDSRRIGLGTAVLSRALEWASSVGIRKVNLEVFASNQPALDLYRKMGFEEEGRRQREFLIDGSLVDGILMAKWL